MCISKAELENKVQEIRRYKAMAEEAAEIQKSLEAEVIAYMFENGIDTAITDSAKSPIKFRPEQHLTRNGLRKTWAILESTPK